jgi:hypothetical protein
MTSSSKTAWNSIAPPVVTKRHRHLHTSGQPGGWQRAAGRERNNTRWGGAETNRQVQPAFTIRPLEGTARPAVQQRSLGKRNRTLGGRTGHYVTSRLPQGRAHDIALDATLRAAAPNLWQRRQRGDGWLALHPTDLREKVREARTGTLVLFAVDASGCMGAGPYGDHQGAIMSTAGCPSKPRSWHGELRGHAATVALSTSVERAQQCPPHAYGRHALARAHRLMTYSCAPAA